MKLTGPACAEAMSGAEEAVRRERVKGNAGGVRVERRVRWLGAMLPEASGHRRGGGGNNLKSDWLAAGCHPN